MAMTIEKSRLTRITAEKLVERYNSGERRFKDMDLTGESLRGVFLVGAVFENVKFGRDMQGAELVNAKFLDCDLGSVNLSGARLNWAYFDNTDLTGANLTSANLSWTMFANGSALGGATLFKANFEYSILSGTDFSGAICTGTDFSNSRCLNTIFSDAVFYGATFAGADLSYAKFINVVFWKSGEKFTVFANSYIGGADFTSAGIKGASLSGTKSIETAIFVGTSLDPLRVPELRRQDNQHRAS